MTEMLRRRRDRLLQWFLALAVVGTVGGFSQVFLTARLYQRVASLQAAFDQDRHERTERLRDFQHWREQMQTALDMRDLDIVLIQKRLEQLDRKKRWDDGLYEAQKDRAGQK